MNPPRSLAVEGFTLVEVLVALSIVAIAFLAIFGSSTSLISNAQRQSDQFLAKLCANNDLVNVRLSAQMPMLGDNVTSCAQGGHTFRVMRSVLTTPNPEFRRVEIRVFDGEVLHIRVWTVISAH